MSIENLCFFNTYKCMDPFNTIFLNMDYPVKIIRETVLSILF